MVRSSFFNIPVFTMQNTSKSEYAMYKSTHILKAELFNEPVLKLRPVADGERNVNNGRENR